MICAAIAQKQLVKFKIVTIFRAPNCRGPASEFLLFAPRIWRAGGSWEFDADLCLAERRQLCGRALSPRCLDVPTIYAHRATLAFVAAVSNHRDRGYVCDPDGRVRGARDVAGAAARGSAAVFRRRAGGVPFLLGAAVAGVRRAPGGPAGVCWGVDEVSDVGSVRAVRD